tara:strand:- start:16298 stop:16765 length:468 start_codon:yes stop_codon:yes gene_type:complete
MAKKSVRKKKKEEAAGMFITDGKSVLLLQRNEPEEEWGLPGGHADKAEGEKLEGPVQTARREVTEEIGKFPPNMKRFQTFIEKSDDLKWTTYMMKVERKFGGIKLSDEHKAHMWMPFEEAPDYKLHPKLARQWSKYVFHVQELFKKEMTFKEFCQ